MMGEMDWRTFITDNVRSLCWPTFLLVIVLIFKEKLKAVAGSLRSVEHGRDGTRLSFGTTDISPEIKAETKVEAEASKEAKEEYPQLQLSEKLNEIIFLFDRVGHEPKGAIMVAWVELTICAASVMKALGINEPADHIDFQRLEESGILIANQMKLFRWMERIGSSVEEGVEVRGEKLDHIFAARYVWFAEAFKSYLLSLKEIPRKWEEKGAPEKK